MIPRQPVCQHHDVCIFSLVYMCPERQGSKFKTWFSTLLQITLSKWATTWQNQQSDWALSEDSDQPGHLPSLIRLFTVHLMGSLGPKLSSCWQRRLWSDWADAQADLSLRWAGWSESSLGTQSLCWFCHVAAQIIHVSHNRHAVWWIKISV